MERFVFVAAVTFAIIWGLVAMVGHGSFGIHINGEEFGGTAPIVQVAPGRMEAAAFAGEELRIKHTAAHITITPEDRADFLIEIDNTPGKAPLPTVTVSEGRVLIDGQLRGRIGDCRSDGGANLRGYGDFGLAELPRITIRAPRNLALDIGGGSTTEVAAAEAVNLDFAGCGRATLGDVAGDLSVDLAGSGDVRGGAARTFTADVAGSGTVTVGAVAESADVDIAGSGDVAMAALNGAFSSDGAGSGSVTVLGGAISTAKIEIAGSADVSIAAPVQSLDVSILGSGNVDVAGAVVDLDAEIAGSGTVSARAVTGSSRREILGSGNVVIGERSLGSGESELRAPPAPPAPAAPSTAP